MPIYEFYCKRCNTIYKFYSKTVNTQKAPTCPKCKKGKLRKMISSFATPSGRKESTEAGEAPFDEAKMERAMSMLAREAEGMNEDDPRQAARLMRKLSEATGLNMGRGMEEALDRLERGEDPDKIEEEFGDLLEGEEPFLTKEKKRTGRSTPRPQTDETLYEL